jgi:16S rRNA (uracil1498-N3)-methyltransferase
VTTFYVPRGLSSSIQLGDDAAHHARVKRLVAGNAVTVTDGRGTRGAGRIASIDRRAVTVDVESVEEVPPPPEINLYLPVADKDRMLWLAEKVTELQVTSWNPVMYERSRSVSPRGEGAAFERKVLARMIGALEQSGGAWLPAIRPIQTVDDLARITGVVLEQDSNPLGRWAHAAPVNLAVGPEGGFTDQELDRLLRAGWSAASFADVTLRFETAAIGGLAIVRSMLP